MVSGRNVTERGEGMRSGRKERDQGSYETRRAWARLSEARWEGAYSGGREGAGRSKGGRGRKEGEGSEEKLTWARLNGGERCRARREEPDLVEGAEAELGVSEQGAGEDRSNGAGQGNA